MNQNTGDVVQWQSVCPAFVRPWIQSTGRKMYQDLYVGCPRRLPFAGTVFSSRPRARRVQQEAPRTQQPADPAVPRGRPADALRAVRPAGADGSSASRGCPAKVRGKRLLCMRHRGRWDPKPTPRSREPGGMGPRPGTPVPRPPGADPEDARRGRTCGCGRATSRRGAARAGAASGAGPGGHLRGGCASSARTPGFAPQLELGGLLPGRRSEDRCFPKVAPWLSQGAGLRDVS
jgi:hypothetical protein